MSNCIITFKGKKYREDTFLDLLSLLDIAYTKVSDFKNKTVIESGEQSILGRLFSKNHMKTEEGFHVDINGQTNMPSFDKDGNYVGNQTKEGIINELKDILNFKKDFAKEDEVRLVNNYLKLVYGMRKEEDKKLKRSIIIGDFSRDENGFPAKFLNEADRRIFQLSSEIMKLNTLVYDKETNDF